MPCQRAPDVRSGGDFGQRCGDRCEFKKMSGDGVAQHIADRPALPPAAEHDIQTLEGRHRVAGGVERGLVLTANLHRVLDKGRMSEAGQAGVNRRDGLALSGDLAVELAERLMLDREVRPRLWHLASLAEGPIDDPALDLLDDASGIGVNLGGLTLRSLFGFRDALASFERPTSSCTNSLAERARHAP